MHFLLMGYTFDSCLVQTIGFIDASSATGPKQLPESSAFSMWRVYTEHSLKFEDTAHLMIQRMLRGAISRCQSAFDTWRLACMHLRVQANLLSAMVSHTTTGAVRRALDRWRAHVAGLDRAEETCRRVLRTLSTQFSGARQALFWRWKSTTQELRHQEQIMDRYCRKVFTTLLRGSIGGAFEIWRETIIASVDADRACVIMQRVGQQWRNSMYVRAWNSWVASVTEGRGSDALMRRVLERILHHGLSGAFLVWLNVCNVLRDLDRDRCHLRKFMERVIRRLLLQPLASAWNTWASASYGKRTKWWSIWVSVHPPESRLLISPNRGASNSSSPTTSTT